MAKTEVIWSPSALERLVNITDYIAKDAPIRAADFAERLLEATAHLENFPLSGSVCAENPACRRIIMQGYRIIYEASENRVEITTIISPGQYSSRILTPK